MGATNEATENTATAAVARVIGVGAFYDTLPDLAIRLPGDAAELALLLS